MRAWRTSVSVVSAHAGPGQQGSDYILSAGEQAIATLQSIAKPKRVNLATASPWTHHELEFDETPLADVVEELNRHNIRQIVIASPSLRAFRVTGVYSTADPTSLLRFLRAQPGMIITESEKNIQVSGS